MTRTLLLTAGLLALATPALAQTGYGQPSSGQYRAEQRTTATLNQRAAVADDGYPEDDRDDDPRARQQPRLDYGDYDRGAHARRYEDDRTAYERDFAANRRARAAHRADLARWRERVAACNDGVRRACAGYEERYGSYAGGRYAPPPPRDDDDARDAPSRDRDGYDDDAPPRGAAYDRRVDRDDVRTGGYERDDADEEPYRD